MTRFPALRQRDFRLLWIGQLFSTIGSQMQIITVNWHIYLLLRGQTYNVVFFGWHLSLNAQAIGLGTLGAVRIVPIFLFALLGGAIADHKDRRQIIIWSQVVACLCATLLGVLTLKGTMTVALLYFFTAADAAINAFNEPAQNALFPELVPAGALPNAATLFSLLFQMSTIMGPLLTGILLSAFPIGVAYLVNAGSFVLVLLATLLLHYRGQLQKAEGAAFEWRRMFDGFHFARQNPLIWQTMLLDFFATLFASARTMLPLVAGQILHTGVQGYSVLATAQPLGALLSGSVLAARKPLKHQGKALLASVALYGLTTALFGISPFFALSYVFFGLTGVGDTISQIIRVTIRQQLTPNALRGRMMSVQMILALGGPQLGEVESGLLAAALGVSLTIFLGGVVTLLCVGILAWRRPELRQYTHQESDDL